MPPSRRRKCLRWRRYPGPAQIFAFRVAALVLWDYLSLSCASLALITRRRNARKTIIFSCSKRYQTILSSLLNVLVGSSFPENLILKGHQREPPVFVRYVCQVGWQCRLARGSHNCSRRGMSTSLRGRSLIRRHRSLCARDYLTHLVEIFRLWERTTTHESRLRLITASWVWI